MNTEEAEMYAAQAKAAVDLMIKNLREIGYTVEEPSLESLLKVAHSSSAYISYKVANDKALEDQLAHRKEGNRLKTVEELVQQRYSAYTATPGYKAWLARHHEEVSKEVWD